MQVAGGCFVDMFRGYDAFQDNRREAIGQQEHDCRHPDLEIDALIEQVTDFLILLFAVAPGNEYLGPDTETEGNHEDDHVEDTGDGRCSQLDFAHTSEEGGVRHTYQLLHKEAD